MIKKVVRIKTNLNSNNVFIEDMTPIFSKEKNDVDIDSKDRDYSLSNRCFWPKIAGILLILTGVFAFVFLIPIITIDTATIQSLIDSGQFQDLGTQFTAEQLRDFYSTCAVIGCVLAVFPLLGGILSIKRKKWAITLICGLIGLFTILLLIIPGILAIIAVILIYLSKQEFQ